MSIIIKEVNTKKDLKKFVRFPNMLYKGNKYYVPFLQKDEIELFNPKFNHAYEYCETKLFLAYKDNKIVGRIAGLINHAYNKKWDKNALRFTRFDFIDDEEVSTSLFNAVVSWGKERGYTQIMGPIGFNDFDHEGMLIEGYDELSMSITFYNYPYYLKHMERLGLVKDIDWVEYQVKVPTKMDERFEKLTEHLLKRYSYRLVTYTNRKILLKDGKEALTLIDEAFAKLYGTVPLGEKVIDKSVKDYISLVNLKYVCSIKDSNDEIVGFGLLLPSIAKALQKSNGRLFPFGFFRLMKALYGKNQLLEMYFVGVKPELQKHGLPAIVMNQILKTCIENNVTLCETGPELETNVSIQSMWKSFDTRQHKRRRCFIKDI